MFTGIVEDLGEVEALEHLGDFARIYVRSGVVTQDARTGDSICVNGVCLTVTGFLPPGGRPPYPPRSASGATTPRTGFTADVMGETLRHSSLKSLTQGTKVNLERSVRLADRLGGHLVQGHTDGTGTVVSREPQENWEVVRIGLPAGLARYVVHKGSIAVDGVSLTVSALSPGGTTPPNPPETKALSPGGTTPPNPPETKSGDDWFEVSLIPETLKRTTLGLKQPGAEVNLEVDVIAKYVERLGPDDRPA